MNGEHDHRDDEHDVDERSDSLLEEKESQEPKNEENDANRQEHFSTPMK
jgi:hypothetical protein